VTGVPPAAVGIVLSTDSTAKFVGQDAGGYGLAPSGEIFHNNSVIATIGSYTYDDYIGLLLDPVGGTL